MCFLAKEKPPGTEVPNWALELHRQKTGRAWPYKRSGVIMINHASELIVLESGSMLKHEVPSIYTRPYYREKYNLPERVSYTSWFEMIYSPTRENAVISSFQIPVTEQGDSLLTSRGLSPIFPAVLGHQGFYYFAGSFSENRVPFVSSYFKGIRWIRSFFYNSGDVLDRRAFFWRYYRRLLSSILDQLNDK